MAQFDYPVHDGKSAAMGGCLMLDPQWRNISAGYRQTFMLNGMADKWLSLTWPTTHGALVADYNHHGDADYHEQAATLGYGLGITTWLSVGVAARYLHIGTSDAYYEPRQWLQAMAIARATMGERTAVTLTFGNRPWDSNSQWLTHLQLAFRPNTRWLAVAEVEHEERTRLRCGMEYNHKDMLALRAGMATHPMVMSFGVGLRRNHLGIDIAAEVHQALGLTPSTALKLWF